MVRIASVPDDAQLPQLQTVTDPVAMREILQHQVPHFAEGQLQIEYLKLAQFKYKPGRKCRISYELHVKNVLTARHGTQLFFAVVERDGRAQARYAAARQSIHTQPEFGPAVHFLPDLNMVLWGFPNDPELRQLPRLLNHEALTDLLLKNWDCFRVPSTVKLEGVTTRVVKYVPEDRCTLRHTLRLAGAGDLVIYSKTYEDKIHAASVFGITRALWRSRSCQSGEIMIPEPLFHERGLGTVFVRGLEGANADDDLSKLDLDRVATKAGAALAGIHQCQIANLATRSDQYAMSKIAEAEETLVNFDGSYRPRLEHLSDTLEQRLPHLTEIAPAPIHGGFRISQLLTVDGKIALLDFDDFLIGNPISDVASFAAHLLYLPLKDRITRDQARSAIRHFCQAYAERAPWGLPRDVLEWQTAAELVGKQAKKCIRLVKKHHRRKVDQLLTMAEDVLAGKLALM